MGSVIKQSIKLFAFTPGMGPKTLSMFHQARRIANLSQLEKALEDGSLVDLPGMGEKKVEKY